MTTITPVIRMVAWEVTRRCNLDCRHCRAAASRGPYEGELETGECLNLLEALRAMGRPVVILTGGEPLLRPDIFSLAARGTALGLRMVMAVNGSLLNEELARRAKDAGIQRISVSLDGASAATHDELRRVSGAFESALRGIAAARKAGLPFQINSTITKRNAAELEAIMQLAVKEGAAAYHVFLLVPTGRGREMKEEELSASAYEDILSKLYRLAQNAPFNVKATCAPHYYRIVREQGGNKERTPMESGHGGLDAVSRGCLAGISFVFISHRGDLQPCGYLEQKCGNVREEALEKIWRESEVFKRLRDYESLHGKCGGCEYRQVCGGCRARAYEASGDFMGPEPLCSYQPRGL